MIIETLTTRTFPAEYLALASNTAPDNLFTSEVWITNFLETVVAADDEVFWIGCKETNNTPLLLLPLWQKPNSNRWAGKRISSLANYYTTLYEPLHAVTDPRKLEQIIDQVATSICQLKWDVIEFYPLNPESESFRLLSNAFKKQSKQVTPYFMYGNWFLLTKGKSYAEYLADRPGQVRNTLKRKINKLKTQNLDISICQHPHEVDSAVSLFEETYRASWKQDEPYPHFIRGLAKAAAERGWLRLGLLFIDQQIAAAQIWFTMADTAYIYKLCQFPTFDNYSPGTILTTHLIQYVIDNDKVTKIDFLSGDDPYKKDWMSDRGERWGLQISNPKTLYGLIQATKNILGGLKNKIQQP